MMGKVGNGVGRAARREIGGGGAGIEGARGNARADQAAIGQRSRADRHVIPFADQVHQPVGQLYRDSEFDIARGECADDGGDEALPHGGRAGDAQVALRFRPFADERNGFVPFRDDAAAMVVEEAARVGQPDGAGRAVKERALHPIFQRGDRAAHMGGGQAERIRAALETARGRHGDKFVYPFPAAHGLSLI